MNHIKLSLVVPCYNEEKNVSLMYGAVSRALEGKEYAHQVEIIFVNDGSKDQTRTALRRLYNEQKEAPFIKVVDFSRNFGKEAAMYAGLKQAVGEYVTIIDADLQQRPEIALDMVDILDAHPEYDCVAAYQEKRREGRVLTFCKNSFYKFINHVTDVKFVQGASDFRTMRRNMVEAVLSMPEYFRFSKGIFSWVGFETHYIPYQACERATGTTTWSFWKLFKYAIEGIISFTTVPLRIATVLGAISSVFSVVYLMVIIIQKLFFSIDVPGYPTIVGLILLIGGIQLLVLGIIGEYLARVYVEGKHRPIYVARDILTWEDGK